tara:strand:+ start:4644 stop:5471 length:828 start_codon:yes stop_codon:yes gene_type:complete
MNRKDIAQLIVKRLTELKINQLKKKYENSGLINHLVIDDLLPKEIASKLSLDFPKEKDLNYLNGLQEKKYVGVYFTEAQKLIEECLFAFQEKSVVKTIGKITSIKELIGDPDLYAGGVSRMSKGCFLNPHIDNSHDRNFKNYRRLNLLYYTNSSWNPKDDGGELVLYPKGIKNKEIKISCDFNRLVIMRTDNRSLHGVKKILSNDRSRKCISNYYFSESSPSGKKYYHSTSFIGFKKEFIKGSVLILNAFFRTSAKKFIYKLTNKSITTNFHRNK